MVEVHQVKKGISQRPEKGLRIAVSESGMREVIKRSEIKILCNSFCPAHLLANTQSNDCTAQSNQPSGVSKSPGETQWSVNIREGREYSGWSLRRYWVHVVTPVVRGAASRESLQQSETIKIGVEDAYDIGVCAVAVAGDR